MAAQRPAIGEKMKREISVFSAAIIVLISLTFNAAWAAGLTGASIRSKALEARVDSLVLIEKKIPVDRPGCAVAIVQDGEIVFKKGYGLANLEKKTPVTPATAFNIGSMTKQFTAACILILSQEGRLSLDDEIHKYLPELPDYGQPVTIRHLIHHTSGIWSNDVILCLSGRKFTDPLSTQNDLKMIFRCHTLNFTPGAEHLYCNSGYVLLGEIVERVSGKSLGAFAQERIFKPLGMNRTVFNDSPDRAIRNEALSYTRPGDSTWIPTGERSNSSVGANNLYTTVEDLARWARNFHDQKVGGLDFTEMMQTRGVLNNGDTLSYAFGLVVGEECGQLAVSHSGATPGFRCDMMRLPEHGLNVICLCNSDQGRPGSIVREIAKLVLGDTIVTTNNTQPPANDSTTKITLEPQSLSAFTGKYQMDNGFAINITQEDTILKGQGTGQNQFVLIQETDSLFHIAEAPEIKMSFHEIDRGQATHIILHQNGEHRLNRVEDQDTLTAAQLATLSGEYYSDELDATYRVDLVSDSLFIHTSIADPLFRRITGITGNDPLVHSGTADTFTLSSILIVFKRNTQGEITGFTIDAGRVRNLLFVRK
jgi:CubicO group peptidase (beta-lactamase class C family)